MKHKATVFKILLILTLFMISYLVFSRPSYSQDIPHFDKIGHLGSFFLLAFLSHNAFNIKPVFLLSGLCVYAGFIEVVQSFLPYRSASIADMMADILGILLFYVALFGYRRIQSQLT